MKVTFEDFCNRVKEDTEKTESKADQYRSAVKYFNEVHEAGSTVPLNESFTPFQNGVLSFLNEKFEKRDSFFSKDIKVLFKSKVSDFRYGYNYAAKVLEVD